MHNYHFCSVRFIDFMLSTVSLSFTLQSNNVRDCKLGNMHYEMIAGGIRKEVRSSSSACNAAELPSTFITYDDTGYSAHWVHASSQKVSSITPLLISICLCNLEIQRVVQHGIWPFGPNHLCLAELLPFAFEGKDMCFTLSVVESWNTLPEGGGGARWNLKGEGGGAVRSRHPDDCSWKWVTHLRGSHPTQSEAGRRE